MTDSYARGDTSAAMLDETIGANLDRAVARFGDARGAGLLRPGAALHLRRAGGRRRRAGPGADGGRARATGDRVGIWSPNCAEWMLVQYATAKLGAILVNINPAYRTSELEYALRAVGLPHARRRARVQDLRLPRRWSRRSARRCPSSSAWCSWTRPTGTSCWPAPARSRPDELRARAGRAAARRPDQHPVHERHHRLSQGRDAHPPQHPQQRLLRRRGLPLHRGGPGLHPGALLPLLRDGDGQPRRAPRTARRWSSRRRPSSPRRRWRRARRSAARRSTACRRCSSPSSTTPASPTTTSARCAPGSWPARRARWR